MESEEKIIGNVHHGHNIRRTRIDKNIKQETLSQLVNLSQSNISRYENIRKIDNEVLEKFAKALDVPLEYLKNLEENAPMMIFESNTVNNNDQATGTTQFGSDQQNSYNPIEKITELYERLLQEKDEKYAALERRLESVEKSIGK